MGPLTGLRVIDFSTLLPGPMASLILAESGADVLKVERYGVGDESRHMSPPLFAMLNRGKRSLSVDLANPDNRSRIVDLVRGADVLIEQFRPGVMGRFGLGWPDLQAVNPRLVYCSITGFGQHGPLANRAGHDLNYQAEAGLLASCPGMPHVLVADIMGGAYPAALNILLALAERARTGIGSHIDVAMTENVFPAMAMELVAQTDGGQSVTKGIFTGTSPRYRLYRTRDGRSMAVGAVEDRFWNRLCELLEVPRALQDDRHDPAGTAAAVAAIFMRDDAAHWVHLLAAEDVCCNLVLSLEEAQASAHFIERGVFSRSVRLAGETEDWPALPLPLVAAYRVGERNGQAPALGEANGQGWLGNN